MSNQDMEWVTVWDSGPKPASEWVKISCYYCQSKPSKLCKYCSSTGKLEFCGHGEIEIKVSGNSYGSAFLCSYCKRVECLACMRACYQNYLSSPEWQEKRKRVLKRDKYRCIRCGSTESLQVAHEHGTYIKSFDNRSIKNLMTLCISCHRAYDSSPLFPGNPKTRSLPNPPTIPAQIGNQ